MKRYLRVMLGTKSAYADECFKDNFIGADFDIRMDLSKRLPDNWREFNLEFIPIWLADHPGKSKISAGQERNSSLNQLLIRLNKLTGVSGVMGVLSSVSVSPEIVISSF
jgi:hypothetical protein